MKQAWKERELKDKLPQVPEKPGAYMLKDGSGKVLYVGKAGNLRSRLTSHVLRESMDQPRLAALYDRLRDFEYIVTGSEIEALILEANLIKLHLPRYNVRLKDDKKYPYIKVTVNEEYPRVFPTRDLKRDGSILFGPYTNARSMRKALAAVTKIFPLRTCKGKLPGSLCLDYQIKRCYGPCEKKISRNAYMQMVHQLTRFLAGKDELVQKELEKNMMCASRRLDFEVAARLRDQLLAVRETIRRQSVVFRDRADRDVVGVSRHKNSACVALFQVRDGKLVSRENYMLDSLPDTCEGELLRTFLGQYYKNAFFIPREIVMRKSFDDVRAFESWMSGSKGRKVRILAPKRGEKMRVLELAELNARYEMAKRTQEATDRTIPESVTELGRSLALPAPPRTIEAYDISNMGGKESVGSLVVFENGNPKKNSYRRFKVRTVEGQDDFAMMAEVVSRRFRRLREEGKAPPDLVLVDGGTGQLNSAKRALEEHFSGVPILGLAKRMDEIHLADGRRLMLPKGSSALHLLQRIRDEAHRFAVSYHRKLRSDRVSESVLDGIRGLGEKRKRELLRYFGSVERLRSATVEDMARVRLVGRHIAARLYEELHRQ